MRDEHVDDVLGRTHARAHIQETDFLINVRLTSAHTNKWKNLNWHSCGVHPNKVKDKYGMHTNSTLVSVSSSRGLVWWMYVLGFETAECAHTHFFVLQTWWSSNVALDVSVSTHTVITCLPKMALRLCFCLSSERANEQTILSHCGSIECRTTLNYPSWVTQCCQCAPPDTPFSAPSPYSTVDVATYHRQVAAADHELDLIAVDVYIIFTRELSP